jgi:hypothetical protein
MTETKLQRALAVRDAVLPWLRRHGALETVERGDGKLDTALRATIGGFDIWFRTPFKGSRATLPDGLPHELHVADCMTLEWADDGRSAFSFRTGRWDAALLRTLVKEGVEI